jgi:ketosteroid isomerase-like protein
MPTAIDRLFAAMTAGDLDGTRDAFTPNARIWHNFDGIAHDRESLLRDWASMFTAFPHRAIHDVRRQKTETGFVQQHMTVMTSASGKTFAWPTCIVFRIEDDRIARLDEYIDRAGSFALEGGTPTTPGFPDRPDG